MRRLSFLPLILAALLLGSCSRLFIPASLYGPTEQEDHQVSTEDLGIHKFTFQARAKHGEVVVFREETYRDGKLAQRCEQVSNMRNGNFVVPVLFIDKSIMLGGTNQGYILRTPQRGGLMGNVRWQGSTTNSSPPKVELTFKYSKDDHFNPDVVEKYIYTMFVESYQSAKIRIPALSNDDPPDSWTYSDATEFDPDTGKVIQPTTN